MDQCFGQTAGYIACTTFDSSNDLVELLDTATKPDLHVGNSTLRKAQSQKLDQTADWKLYVSRLGLRMKGLRILDELINVPKGAMLVIIWGPDQPKMKS